MVSGEADKKKSDDLNERTLRGIEALLNEKTMSVKDIAAFIAEKENLAYRKVYKECLAQKRLLKDS